MLIKSTTGLVNDSFELCRKFYGKFTEIINAKNLTCDFESFKSDQLSIDKSAEFDYLMSVDPLDVVRVGVLREKKKKQENGIKSERRKGVQRKKVK